MAELRPLERLMAADADKSAAQRFAERMQNARIETGAEAPVLVPDEPVTHRVLRVTPAMATYLASLLEGQQGLEADTLRIALDLPLPSEERVLAGQTASGGMHSVCSSLSTPTTG
ncbi:hypothetical protein [Streptomyces sp. CBMA29]|uniref:hypothetical protein n=1 Tax=Streptomyces sp. CBMA29 TaxID=1896314 RepID=UPI001661CA0D|nr:hypothetical protein [Streptomyces sp. CBMA29]MBD0733978.1 hypothetical protein [Streptomyces sp. CBMA29]